MKFLRLFAALLVLATDITPAVAATNPPTLGLPYQASRVTRDKRIAVIQMARQDLQTNNIKLSMIRHAVPALDAFRGAGGEIHRYKSTFFETAGGAADKDHREMWTDIGSQYAAVIVLWPCATTTANTSRYICADSTNAQLIVIGGAEMGGLSGWQEAVNTRGVVDTSTATTISNSSSKGSGLVLMDDRDTLWSPRISTGKRVGALATGIDTVVRLLRPIVERGYSFTTNDADSNSYRPVGSWNTAYGADWTPGALTRAMAGTRADSVAGPGEVLGPLWKVHFTKYSGQDDPAWINSLATTARGVGGGGTSPQWAYWLKVASNPNPGEEVTHLLWGLMCKFTTVAPLPYYYDWDDATDVFDGDTYPRWRNTAAESSLAALAIYGIKPTNMINPRNARDYINATTPPYEASAIGTPLAWTGPAHTYLSKLTWVHHAHDSSQGIFSNLFGGYGGYNPGNGAGFTQGGTVVQKWGHRVASRWNPGATEEGGAGRNFGIVQRLDIADSLRNAIGGSPFTPPPYVASPANEHLPVNWRARPTTNNPLWTYHYSSAASCPIDSVVWAVDYGLNGHKLCGEGRVVWRVYTGPPWGGITSNYHTGGTSEHDRDSMVAVAFFKRAGEVRVTRVGERIIESVSVGTFLQGIGSRTFYMDNGSTRALTMLGLRGGSVMAEKARTDWGSTYSASLHAASRPGTGGVLSGTYSEGYRNTTRGLYQHPGQETTNPNHNGNHSGDAHVETFIRSIVPHLKVANAIAGREATKCYPAWMIQDKLVNP